VEKITYRCATKIFPNSIGLREIILENKFTTKNKINVIGNGSSNGIDISHFDIKNIDSESIRTLKSELKIQMNDFVFVFIGRLVEDKGLNELISAFVKINDDIKNTKLLLVGSYENNLSPLKNITLNNIKAHKNIIAVGYQKDVRPYFAISNALVFPSYREGFPNVVLQAGAMKLPCIVTNINGCNEIISDNVNGIIIPVKNVEAIIYAMKKLYLTSKEEQIIMGEKSRAIIASKYEQKFIWNALLDEYNILSDI
jgi:glycosyltransferase involved in cell wall biosynthesis